MNNDKPAAAVDGVALDPASMGDLLERLERVGVHRSVAARYCAEAAGVIRRLLGLPDPQYTELVARLDGMVLEVADCREAAAAIRSLSARLGDVQNLSASMADASGLFEVDPTTICPLHLCIDAESIEAVERGATEERRALIVANTAGRNVARVIQDAHPGRPGVRVMVMVLVSPEE